MRLAEACDLQMKTNLKLSVEPDNRRACAFCGRRIFCICTSLILLGYLHDKSNIQIVAIIIFSTRVMIPVIFIVMSEQYIDRLAVATRECVDADSESLIRQNSLYVGTNNHNIVLAGVLQV